MKDCSHKEKLTGQVPPEIMRSNESASGIPAHMLQELADLIDSSMDLCFSSPLREFDDDRRAGGRV